MMLPSPRVMLITDKSQTKLPWLKVVEEACEGGCRWVLLRDPTANIEALRDDAAMLKNILVKYSAQLFISQHVALAVEMGASGIHLKSNQSVKEARTKADLLCIGQSCHNADEAARAVDEGADYITFSPVFQSPSKPDYPPQGIELLRKIVAECPIPVIALGGITAKNATECLKAGARGVAIMGAVMASENPKLAMQHYLLSDV